MALDELMNTNVKFFEEITDRFVVFTHWVLTNNGFQLGYANSTSDRHLQDVWKERDLNAFMMCYRKDLVDFEVKMFEKNKYFVVYIENSKDLNLSVPIEFEFSAHISGTDMKQIENLNNLYKRYYGQIVRVNNALDGRKKRLQGDQEEPEVDTNALKKQDEIGHRPLETPSPTPPPRDA